MPGIPPLPDLPPVEERPPWLAELLAVVVALREDNHRLREENQLLRDEVARLKKQKGKPSIGPSRLNKKERKERRGGRRHGKTPDRRVDRTELIRAEAVPQGSEFKGYADYVVENLVIKLETTLFRVEKWLTPEGKLVTGQLPVEVVQGSHFGATLQSFILDQYYHAQVTEPLILEQLHEWGATISSGQLHRLITENKARFHLEKDEILRVGLRVSGHVHVDDTGARHKGKNGYCTHIGNQWFAWFQSTESKSRINFLELLRSGHRDYVLDGVALEYMLAQKLPQMMREKLALEGDATLADETAWKAALVRLGFTDERHVRIATEGALLAAALSHGLSPNLAIISDDAGQFNLPCAISCVGSMPSACWPSSWASTTSNARRSKRSGRHSGSSTVI